MHIGFSILTVVPGGLGGSESAARSLLTEFASLQPPEHVTVLANSTAEKPYADLESGAVHFHTMRFSPGIRAPARAMSVVKTHLFPGPLLRHMPAKPLDVLHYPFTVPIPRIAGVPTVVTLHDVQHEVLPELFSRAERAYRDWIYRTAAVRANIVATPSAHSKATITEHYGIPPERIRVIPWGVDLGRFSAQAESRDEEIMRSLEVPGRFIFYPANLWPHKNHGRLLEALASQSIPPDLHLILTGATYGRLKELHRRGEELGLADRVHHLGYVPSDVLPVLYRRAAALVFPSLFEGFGMPLLEAAACGCPVAASRSGSIEEVMGDAAVYFDPRDTDQIADVISRIVSDESLSARLRDQGRVRTRDFSWPRAAALYLDAYRAAASS